MTNDEMSGKRIRVDGREGTIDFVVDLEDRRVMILFVADEVQPGDNGPW